MCTPEESQLTSLANKLDGMVKKTAGKKQVTLGMLKRSARCKFGERATLNAFHARARAARLPLSAHSALQTPPAPSHRPLSALYRALYRALWHS